MEPNRIKPSWLLERAELFLDIILDDLIAAYEQLGKSMKSYHYDACVTRFHIKNGMIHNGFWTGKWEEWEKEAEEQAEKIRGMVGD